MNCELKLAGGHVIDGSGAAAVKADVTIDGGVIRDVGDLQDVEAARTIDCTGKTITPGFIDIHSHTDWLLPGSDHGRLVEPFVRQGMTTLVTGNCGFSPAPITPVNRSSAQEASRLIIDDSIDLRWESMREFLDTLARRRRVSERCTTRRAWLRTFRGFGRAESRGAACRRAETDGEAHQGRTR